MMKIVYACNDKLFDGLYLSILSIVRRTKEPIQFYLLTADCTYIKKSYAVLNDEHKNIIEAMIKSYNRSNTFKIIDCSKNFEQVFKHTPNANSSGTPYTLLRLLLHYYPDFDDRVLYLDTDTMATGDVKEFNNVELGDNEFAVSHNYYGWWHLSRNYFNAGVVLFNMPIVRKTKLLEKACQLLSENEIKWPDQTALYRAASKYMFFPDDEFRFNHQQISMKDPGIIIKHFSAHFWGWPHHNNIKQWQIDDVHKYLKIHNFDEDYKIFTAMKAKELSSHEDTHFIEVDHLNKSYGDIKAVDDISFTVKKGSLFAFLGVNGAGKSTTINIISSTLMKDSGTIKIDSLDLEKDNAKVKREIGIVFQNSALDGLLTVKENLMIRARFYKMDKNEIEHSINRVIKMLNLEPILNQEVNKLSGGQRRRVDIARALLHEPKLLMLDEPTTGLDPKTRLDVWRLIDEVRQRTKMTVFLTTHYLEEAEKATYVEIMNKGKIIAEGTPNELKNRYSTDHLIAYQKKNALFEKNVKGYKYQYDHDAEAYRIKIKDSDDAKKLLNKYGKYITDFEIQKGTMDDVFLKVTGGIK